MIHLSGIQADLKTYFRNNLPTVVFIESGNILQKNGRLPLIISEPYHHARLYRSGSPSSLMELFLSVSHCPTETNRTENHEIMFLFPYSITPINFYWDSSLKKNNSF
jgi:hypothetical protein